MAKALHSELPENHRHAFTLNSAVGTSGPVSYCIDRTMRSSSYLLDENGRKESVVMTAFMRDDGHFDIHVKLRALRCVFARAHDAEAPRIAPDLDAAKDMLAAFEAASTARNLPVIEGAMQRSDHYSFVREIREHAPYVFPELRALGRAKDWVQKKLGL